MTLLDKLGGLTALDAVVEEMYQRLMVDQVTSPFFENFTLAHLKHHQVRFMKIAFTEIPNDMDVPEMIRRKHAKLFATKGLNETHFDKVVEHLWVRVSISMWR